MSWAARRSLSPKSLTTFEFTPPGGPTQTETLTTAKANPQGEVTCSLDASETSPEGTFRVFGTATGFFTPAS
jgi:hypothetical protein